MTTIRIAHVIVQPVLVYDDGEELAPGPTAAAKPVAVSALAGLADTLRAEVEALNREDPAKMQAMMGGG